eukprot:Clim_evm90s150 gene=Clim_evmTU90s150
MPKRKGRRGRPAKASAAAKLEVPAPVAALPTRRSARAQKRALEEIYDEPIEDNEVEDVVDDDNVEELEDDFEEDGDDEDQDGGDDTVGKDGKKVINAKKEEALRRERMLRAKQTEESKALTVAKLLKKGTSERLKKQEDAMAKAGMQDEKARLDKIRICYNYDGITVTFPKQQRPEITTEQQ